MICVQFARRAVGMEVNLVEIDGDLRFRVTDRLPPDPRANWLPPHTCGLAWAQDEPARCTGGPSKGRARGPGAYFDAARELLAEAGADALTLDSLCRRVRVTKGSFRWHFDTMAGFLDALAAHWVQTEEDRLSRLRAEPAPRLRLQGHLQHLLCRPDPAATAFRAWAHTEPAIGCALRRIDQAKQDAYTADIGEVTDDPNPDLLAEAMLAISIGLHQRPPDVGPDLATRIVHLWANRFLRVPAELDITDGMPVLTVARHTPA
jgi:AcrR family transcriptional regulator